MGVPKFLKCDISQLNDYFDVLRLEFSRYGLSMRFALRLMRLALLFVAAANSVVAETHLGCDLAEGELELPTCAEPRPITQDITSQKLMKDRSSFYFQISSYDYVETSVMSKRASLPFLGFGYSRSFPFLNRSMYFNIEGQFGITSYEGTGVTDGDKTFIVATQLQRNWRYDDIVLSAGLGYRFVHDAWGGQTTSNGLPTYDRRSEYLFGSVGGKIEFKVGSSFSLHYRHLFLGKQSSDIHSTSWDGSLTKRQPNGYGVAMEYELKQRRSVYIDYWSISNSAFDDQGQGFFEPANRSIQIGLRHKF